jgi:hypothetical protein
MSTSVYHLGLHAGRWLIINGSSLWQRVTVPTVYSYRFMVERGGLISYGVDIDNLFERAATYVDRILKGAKPAELPVQAPTKFASPSEVLCPWHV